MGFCLPKENTTKFIEALKDGRLDPAELASATSKERHQIFSDLVGPENARDVNALFESKLLLKDYKTGLVSWAKQVAGITPKVRRDLIARIEHLDRVLNPAEEKVFLADLAAERIGANVSMEEAKNIYQYSQDTQKLRSEYNQQKADTELQQDPTNTNAGWSSPEARLKYGIKSVEYHDYLNHLLGKEKVKTFKESLKTPIRTVAGATKGVLAAFDNSFFGRQGLRMLFNQPKTWSRAFAKSWVDGGKQLVGIDVMKAIRADVMSRPNAVNGKYQAMGVDVGVNFEEAFPSTLPEKVPILGQIYKASETMFNGAALHMRADYADKMIGLAENKGLNMKDPRDARGVGYLVNSMTGRGDIGRAGVFGNEINTAFFSVRFLKANIDTLTLHQLDMGKIKSPEARLFVRRQAAENLARTVAGVTAILFTANQLWPGSVETDPRSSNFGKIKIGKTRIDVTGGLGSLITLAMRLLPTEHHGKLSLWYKSSTSNKYTDLLAGKYGQQTGMDVIDSFWQGKLSPLAGTLRDAWTGKVFGGQKATPTRLAANLITPLPVQTAQDLLTKKGSAPFLAGMILDGLGFSTNTY